jgi:hypothetical protein
MWRQKLYENCTAWLFWCSLSFAMFTPLGMGLINNRNRVTLTISWYLLSVQEKPVMSNIGKSTNILWHDCPIGQPERQKLLGQKGCVIWITGLSGSGIFAVFSWFSRGVTFSHCWSSILAQLSVSSKWVLPVMMVFTLLINLLVWCYNRRIDSLLLAFNLNQ